ncbi:MAG: flagellar motor switch phosphatase FliY [Syntrophomonadaceae bacterium]
MSDGMLSQEEIDALLSNNSVAEETANASSINEFDRDTLGEIGNISMGTSATTLSTLLGKKVSITTPRVEVTTPEKLRAQYPMPYVMVEVQYTEGLHGTNVLVIKEEDACIIADLMMGGAGVCEQISLTEIELSAVGEAMNQMMGSATTSLSSMFNRRIDIAPPVLNVIDLAKDHLDLNSHYDDMVSIKFNMEIEDLVNSEIMQIIPLDAVKKMIAMLMGSTTEESSLEDIIETPEPPRPAPELTAPPSAEYYAEPAAASAAQETWVSQPQDIPSGVHKGQQYTVQPVQFAPLREGYAGETPQNIGLIMDVPLDISVELGKTRKTIREILDLHQGAILQLDKLAGEPVDLLVNGKLVAKGEVVVIDENYGIRITAIVSPMDRVNKLQ